MSLPIFQTNDKNFLLMQNGWAQQLNPVILNPVSQGILLSNIALKAGVTVINHTLGRNMQGWTLADVNGAATIYRSKPLNDLTLTLTSSAAVTVNLLVY